jgi:dihydroxy-acid dehydratase
LMAVAHEAGIAFSLEQVNEISQQTPNIAKISPSSDYHIEDLDLAGGIPAVMHELSSYLNLDCGTVTGRTVKENIENATILNQRVIHSLSQAYSKTGGLTILFGNLAPEGCVVKSAAVAPEMMVHRGQARVFESEDDATQAIMQNSFKSGDVIIIRYEGPRGGPGMREMLTPTSLLSGMAMDREVALITDGRFSGATRGAAIGHVSPEAALRGPIAALRDGDMIKIDIPGNKIEVELSETEIKDRLSKLPPFKLRVDHGYLKRYAENVGPASRGAVFM